MSVLSNLEKELGLDSNDLSIFEGVDLSASLDKSFEVEKPVKESNPVITTIDTTCNIDLRETAHKMGIDYISVCNLYQQVHNMLKTTNNPRVIEILNKIINGLKTGNMSRADINNLIVDLNNAV